MKKIAILLCIAIPCQAGLIVHNDYVGGNVITAAGQNTNENTIVNEINGNLDNTNIKAGGVATSNIASNAITYSLLATGLSALWSYRKPVLVYNSGSVVNIETGLDGTSGDVKIIFPDGTTRTDSTTGHVQINIGQVAALTGSVQSGLDTGTAAANTWYACYAVKSQANSTDIIGVCSLKLPIQANYASLNSTFGSNSWVYLGMIRRGDNGGATTSILTFTQNGNMTLFGNTNSAGNYGLSFPGTILATSASSSNLQYTPTSGTGTTDIPNNIGLCYYLAAASSGTNTVKVNTSAIVSTTSGANGRTGFSFWGATNQGVGIAIGSASAADISLLGFVDGALGVGGNPLL